NIFESNRASENWTKYGINNFYRQVRAGNTRMTTWSNASAQKLNFAFARVNENGVSKIYHLHNNLHQFSSKPALAYDYTSPSKLKNQRALMNLSGLALGFVPVPGWIKSNVQGFINSFYVEQVRVEGALVGYFESQNDQAM